MDASTLIATALTTAITEIGKGALPDAAKAAYGRLKELLQKRFQGKKDAEVALVKAEQNPKESQAVVRQAIIGTSSDQIPEIVECARDLLSIIRPQQASIGKYNTNVSGNVQGFAQGDGATINMTINDK
jgi:hypothetical protein